MNKKYYVPTSSKPQTATVGEFRQVNLETDAIVQRVSKDLYASPASGIRELLANEIRAAVKAKEQGANPRIEVTVTNNMIRVWGIDSLGMERDIFESVYMTLGRSSNFDGKTAGQFGLGRAAYTTISDHMLLETNCRNGDKYSVLGVEGRGYQTGLPEPDIPYGTRVTMAPRDDESYRVDYMVINIAKRSPIPITLVTERSTTELQQAKHVTTEHTFHLKTDAVEFHAIPTNYRPNTLASYLCGMPIEFKYRGKYGLTHIVLDIHDERKFPPTPDRERLTEKAERELSALADAEIERRRAAFPSGIKAAMEHPDRMLVYYCGGSDNEADADTMREVVTQYKTKRQIPLGSITGYPVLSCDIFYKGKMEAVWAKFPHAAFVKSVGNITSMDEFMERENITVAKDSRTKRRKSQAVLHVQNGTERIDPDDPPSNYMIFKMDSGKDLAANRALILHSENAALTIYDVAGAMKIETIFAEARAHTYDTSKGRMTGKQLLDSGLRVYFTDKQSLVDCWGDGPDTDQPSIAAIDTNSTLYAALKMQGDRRIWGMRSVPRWHYNTRALETYLRLDNPILKEVLLTKYKRTDEICDEFLRLDNKEPVAWND